MRNVRLALGGVAPKSTASEHAFDHAAALGRLNDNVRAANAALRRCHHALSDAELKRLARHAAKQGGLTVVSYCDGKATCLGFLLRAGVRVRRYLSVEKDANANRVARNLYGAGEELLEPSALRFYADAYELTVEKLKALDCHPVHLLLSSTPCQDLSGCKDVSRCSAPRGLEGAQSRLFVEFAERFWPAVRLANERVPLMLLVENVRPSRREDEHAMSALLGLPALRSEAAVFEASRRPRLLFCNVPYASVPLETPNITLQSVLNAGAVALGAKAGCILATALTGANEHVSTARSHSERNRGRTLVLCSAHSTDVRGLHVTELAAALGQPAHEVDAAAGSDAERCGLLGRSVACGQMVHALRRLIDACVSAQQRGGAGEEGGGAHGSWQQQCQQQHGVPDPIVAVVSSSSGRDQSGLRAVCEGPEAAYRLCEPCSER